ncbi:MAG TPA: lipopolysaccharide biosynthesis protein [Methylocella sp.]|nr:lipopolysaccharide biosynthesis protein [Methylocella sp.]
MTVFSISFCNILINFAIGLFIAKFLGPAEYGRFALAYATAVFVQTGFFDWIRLGATRFYSERTRSEDPALRATLDFSFAVISAALAAGACLLMWSGVKFTLSNGLIALALTVAVANGLFDYHVALVRACFDDRLFARLALVKNALAIALMGGGAFLFGSAEMTLAGTVVSLAGSIVTARAALADPASKPSFARLSIARHLMSYSLPIVGATLLYIAIPLANRSILAILDGFSETGQFSLAFDFGTKAIQTIGSALDIVLFQIAVATHELEGPTRARQQIARNMTIVIAMVLPACTGLWLTLPSVETLIVPEQYRGHFDELLPLMMTGFFAMALIQFAITPIFLIEKRTVPLISAALAACAADPLFLLILHRDHGAASLAIAQAGAMLVAVIVLIAAALPHWQHWPRLRDLAVAVFGNALMGAIVFQLRDKEPGFSTLSEQVSLGVLVYAAVILGLDVAGLRQITMARLRLTLARLKTL